MAQIYRLYGVEFLATQLKVAIPQSNGKTGFEIGSDLGFRRDVHCIRENHISESMGWSTSDDASMDFEDQVRYGDQAAIDFVRDIIAGYESAKSYMKMATDAVAKLAHCLYYLGSKRVEASMAFPPDFIASMEGYDFYVNGVNNVALSATVMFSEHPVLVKGGQLLLGAESNIPFAIHKDMVYTQETCRAMHGYLGLIVQALYEAIEEHMTAEYQAQAVDYVRRTIEERVNHTFGSAVEIGEDIPNFYLQEKKSTDR